MNPFFTSASGKLDPSHDSENMCFTLNGKTYSRKLCNPRNLTTNPYSTDELQRHDLFKRAWQAVAAIVADPDTYAQALARYKANPGKYNSLRGFLFAEKYKELKGE